MEATKFIKLKMFLLNIFDLFTFFCFVTGIVFFVKLFIIHPYVVEGASMEPTFYDHDFIVVEKISPKIKSLNRGDIIVFVPKGQHLPFIKRVVGLPGETIRIMENKVYVCSSKNNEEELCNELNEAYLPNDFVTSTRQCKKDVFNISDEGYFVLGDNRDHSTDSRCCFSFSCHKDANYEVFPIDVIGKVMIRVWPNFASFLDIESKIKLDVLKINTYGDSYENKNDNMDVDFPAIKKNGINTIKEKKELKEKTDQEKIFDALAG